MSGERIAVVTGGGTGIGLATTQLLARKGWQVTAIGLECAHLGNRPGRNARERQAALAEAECRDSAF